MDEPTFGERLAAARRANRLRTQQSLADLVGVSARTIRNYDTGATRPDAGTLELLRRVLGPFDSDADPVETAVRSSRLTEDRQHIVIGTYKRHLREQDDEQAGRRGA